MQRLSFHVIKKRPHLGVTHQENQLPLSEQNASNFLYQIRFAVSHEVGLSIKALSLSETTLL